MNSTPFVIVSAGPGLLDLGSSATQNLNATSGGVDSFPKTRVIACCWLLAARCEVAVAFPLLLGCMPHPFVNESLIYALDGAGADE